MTPEQLTKPDETKNAEESESFGNAVGNGAVGSTLDQHVAMEEAETQKLSKKKLKKLKQLSISQLKQLVPRPDVVEIHDVTAPDPKLLVTLKSYRNTVPVPRHWSQKRKYLQGKRGIEKPPFQLPDFIKATGIQEVRESHREAEEKKKAKQKARERILPKMGKIDIDFNVLHDAFFKFQSKPKLTAHGDLYYEGKENEVKLQHLKPGFLSERLRNALGMPPGAPPPWLINMQRFGPPPSYPSLKIPGLNAPIPEGASWGYHPGGWGRPPVDEQGRPLYGDVFRKKEQEVSDNMDYDKQHSHLYRSLILNVEDDESIQLRERREKWGTIAEEQITEEQPKLLGARDESDEEEEEQEEETKMSKEALESGTTSVPVGVETPDVISLRKNVERPPVVAPPPTQHHLPPPAPVKRENEPPRQLYQVIEQQPVSGVPSNQLMGSTFKYNLSGPSSASAIQVDSVTSSYEESLARSTTGESEASSSTQEDESKKRKRQEDKKKKEREKKKIKF